MTMAWIRVKDRLPDPGPDYLLWCNGGGELCGHSVGQYIGDGQFIDRWETRTIDNVTHWTHLPTPPED